MKKIKFLFLITAFAIQLFAAVYAQVKIECIDDTCRLLKGNNILYTTNSGKIVALDANGTFFKVQNNQNWVLYRAGKLGLKARRFAEYQEIYYIDKNSFLVKDKESWGLINLKDLEFHPIKYNIAGKTGSFYKTINKNNKIGLLNLSVKNPSSKKRVIQESDLEFSPILPNEYDDIKFLQEINGQTDVLCTNENKYKILRLNLTTMELPCLIYEGFGPLEIKVETGGYIIKTNGKTWFLDYNSKVVSFYKIKKRRFKEAS